VNLIRYLILLLLFTTGCKTNGAHQDTSTSQGVESRLNNELDVPKPPITPHGASAIYQAAAMARLAYNTSAPWLMVEAAYLLKTSPRQDLKVQKTTRGEGIMGLKEDQGELSAKALLERARELADGDENLLSRIEQVATLAADRGPVSGPKFTCDRVLGSSSDVYQIELAGGEPWQVIVVGDGDTDLDLYVYDEHKNLISSDTYTSDLSVSSGKPRHTAAFHVEIRNVGKLYNEYCMIVR
jgi:hypothetical protein